MEIWTELSIEDIPFTKNNACFATFLGENVFIELSCPQNNILILYPWQAILSTHISRTNSKISELTLFPRMRKEPREIPLTPS